MSEEKPLIIIYKESLAQSLISDLATFGLLLLCIYVSQGSAWWTFVTGCVFLFFILAKAIAVTKSDSRLRFYSLDDLRKWADEQETKS